MTRLMPLGGENFLKVLLVPPDNTPEVFLGRKRDFILLGALGLAFMFTFKLLMENLVPSLFEVLAVWLIASLVILALFRLVRMINRKAKEKHIEGVTATLCIVLFLVLLL